MRSSYAQNFEDVWLWRAFGDIESGFYVDVGAFDPEEDSVTKLFYDSGWTGINIEPGARFGRFEIMRPRDTNLNLAASDQTGELAFCDRVDAPGQSSVVRSGDGNAAATRAVPCTTLTALLDRHAAGRHIHFLKIDTEGHEARVIAGNDWSRYRPEMLIIESTVPGTNDPNHETWEPILTDAGYVFAYFDGINRFYVRGESQALREVFAVPVNVLDGFTRSHPAAERILDSLSHRNRQLEAERSRLLADLVAPPGGSRALEAALRLARTTRSAYWGAQARRAAISRLVRRARELPAALPSRIAGRSRRRVDGSRSSTEAPPILVDVTHMANTTVRTGIQRVVHSICGKWPDPASIGLIVFDDDGTVQLLGPAERRRLIGSFHGGGDFGTAAPRAPFDRISIADWRERVIVCPELCTEPFRLKAYRQLVAENPKAVHFIVYDLIPWLFPNLYPREFTEAFTEYLDVVAAAPNIAFISEGVRARFCSDLCRSADPNFVAVSLGADGLGSLPPPPFPRPARFTVLGTIEPRKNHALVLAAYDQLKPIYRDLELEVVGPPGWAPRDLLDDLERRSGLGHGVTWHKSADDITVRNTIRSSRATVYPSAVEGYGLPVVESLALGVPVIAPMDLPAAEEVAGKGVIPLEVLDVPHLMHAMELSLNEGFLQVKAREIAGLELSTWNRFGASFASWIADTSVRRR